MKGKTDMRVFLVSCALLCYGVSHAQLKQIPFARQGANSQSKQSTSETIQSTGQTAINLPFWDDFSFNNSAKGYANDALWQYGESVWVNTGLGINPPTYKVATFDGIDSLGKPYNVNVAAAKGIADRLVSKPIRMDHVDPSLQDNVFIFFYYQYQGNGEPPDPGDEFSLWFKAKDSTWNKVWSVQYDTLKDKTKFYPVKIFVNQVCDSCFTDFFQFRFQNFARLSGPFDTWNLDYVYVSNGKPQTVPPIAVFPDRAIATPLTSLVKQYQSIPVKHLLSQRDSLLDAPFIVVTNHRQDQNPIGQPAKMGASLTTTVRMNKVVQPPVQQRLDSIFNLTIVSGVPLTVPAPLPSFDTLNQNIDSLAMKYFMGLKSNDNEMKSGPNGDYDTAVYKDINFTYNDTVTTNFVFSSYYAYDDGEAEYAATLINPGNYLAYQFDMMYFKLDSGNLVSLPDTLVAVDVYFPHVGDESSQVLQLQIYDQLPDFSLRKPLGILTRQDVVVSRSENNLFRRIILDTAVIVKDKFFVGFMQSSSAFIGIGLDKDSDSGDKIFSNFGVEWEQSSLHGNLMIRPVFGNSQKTKGPITGIEEKKVVFYPNPNHGSFYLSQGVQQLQVVDIAGRPVSFEQEDSFEATRINLHHSSPGIYIARYFNGTQWRTEKIMVLP